MKLLRKLIAASFVLLYFCARSFCYSCWCLCCCCCRCVTVNTMPLLFLRFLLIFRFSLSAFPSFSHTQTQTRTLTICVLWAVGLIYIVYSDSATTTALIPKVPFAVISLNEWSLIKLIDFGCYQLVDVKPKEASREKSEFTCFGLNENFAIFRHPPFVALVLCWLPGCL